MGWTFARREQGISHKEFFAREWPEFSKNILDIAQGTPHELYMACRIPDGVDQGKVYCLTVETANRYTQSLNFSYKEVDEFNNSTLCHCPQRILDLLTPVDEFAAETDRRKYLASAWRREQEDNLIRTSGVPKVKQGQLLETVEPVEFKNGEKFSLFYKENSRGSKFWAMKIFGDGLVKWMLVRLTMMKDSEILRVWDNCKEWERQHGYYH